MNFDIAIIGGGPADMLSDSPCLQGLRRRGGTGVPLFRELGKAWNRDS